MSVIRLSGQCPKLVIRLTVSLLLLWAGVLPVQAQFQHRGYLGWVRDLASEPTVGQTWPSIRIDETLTKDYEETLDFMTKRGLNELSLWGFYTDRNWEPAVEQTITPDRKALVDAWIEKAHRRGINVLAGMGIYSWGFHKIMAADSTVKCPCNAEVMDLANPKAWEWQRRVLDYVMDNFRVDGFSMQSADKGRCTCGELAGYSDNQYHALVYTKCTEYIRQKRPDYLIGISGWGMDFGKEADLPAIRQMTRQVDYLIDVGETAVKGGRGHRQKLIEAIRPCAFGTLGSPHIEAIQALERDRYFIPTIYRAGQRLKNLYADGGRACETYMRTRVNPADELSVEATALLERHIDMPVSSAVRTVLRDIYQPRDLNTLTALEAVFRQAEEAYFDNAVQQDIILLSAREITVSEIPGVYRQMSPAQRANYLTRLRGVRNSARALLPRVGNKARLQILLRCVGRAIDDLVAVQRQATADELNHR